MKILMKETFLVAHRYVWDRLQPKRRGFGPRPPKGVTESQVQGSKKSIY